MSQQLTDAVVIAINEEVRRRLGVTTEEHGEMIFVLDELGEEFPWQALENAVGAADVAANTIVTGLKKHFNL